MAYLVPEVFVRTPEALERQWSLQESLSYTRWLATHHYENFQVVSFLLPKRLHADFYNVYAFCRWADDLGDEIGDTRESLRLLAWWRSELERLYTEGTATHPVFVALAGTIRAHQLPAAPFSDLITAFEHDQTNTRYKDWSEVLGYCRHSANPVGRLVLYLCGYRDTEFHRLSDFTCTALQLANFWQDVSVDLRKDRVYLPLDLLERHRYSVDDLFAGDEDERFQGAMAEAVSFADELFRKGLPLIDMVDRRLSLDLDLFSRGGMRVLDKIRQQDYRVLHNRPSIGKVERVTLLLTSLTRLVSFRRAAAFRASAP
ncbi:MAG TPA: squalene synthase HpnC [Bryobacteraceae bacterium]|nr:squalene synthase HpnC [Bryobacteraceae bacterium]